jgi:hypothetical protein
MQEVWGRLFERNGLNPLEKVGLTELRRVQPRRALALADKNGMDLLTQGAFPGCHQYPRATPDSASYYPPSR